MFNASGFIKKAAALFLASTALFVNAEEKIVEVLAVGNSFSGNAARYASQLNGADPANKLMVYHALIGGCSFEKHLRLAKGNESDPENPEFKPYKNPTGMAPGNYGLKEILQFKKWKLITIQQVSNQSDDIKSFRPYAAELKDFIKKYAPDAEIIVHEIWADRVDNSRLKEKTQEEMYKGLNNAYSTIAKELGDLRMIPVGDAFQITRERADFKFTPDMKFDRKNAVYPALPDQTHALCIGWMWSKDPKTGEQKMKYDHHANDAGCFLAALVWRQFFFPELDVRKNTFRPSSVSEEDAKILREVAYDTVMNKTKPAIAK